ncbi:MAG TPA: lysophospholipid acyltransferase family protein [Chthoniobacterales bacterium]
MYTTVEETTKESRPNFAAAYRFADLSSYSFKERLLIRAADLAAYLLISLVGLTARYEFEGLEHYEQIERQGIPAIHTLWHDCIYLAIYYWQKRRIAYMTSRSFDGEYIARFLQRFGFGAVRGSSSRGAIGAMIEMARMLRAGISVGFTIDGPRGPRREAKMGAVTLAKKSGRPILPFYVEAASRWTTRSWDRLQLPKPFTRARLEIAPVIWVPADADDEALDQKLAELQKAMDELTRRAEDWRANL